MAGEKYLIVNADDFGMSRGVNQGIIHAHEQGIVTSASLMVRSSSAPEAASYGREHLRLSVGLHVDLGEWIFAGSEWKPVYQVVPLDNEEVINAEVARQIRLFRDLMGRNPTHLDSHQHVHRAETVRSVLVQQARELGVVLRGENPDVRYCGDFYGQADKGHPYVEAISVEALLKILAGLPAGFTEMGCHPGDGTELNSAYRSERNIECQTLCDPRVIAAIAEKEIVLCSFSDR